jgi:amino acid adenylation domain-containing protein
MKVSVPAPAKPNHPAKQNNGDRLNQGSCETLLKAEFGNGGDSRPVPASGLSRYWETYLADAPALDLPTDRPRPAALGSTMGVDSCSMAEELSEGLRQLSREAGVEAATCVLAAYAVILYRYTSQERFVIAVGRDGRMLPIVAELSDRPAFVHLLRQLEAAIRDGSQAEAIPADLPERLEIEADASRHAIFQAAFSSASSPAPLASRRNLHSETSGLDLHLQFSGNSLRLDYNEDLFDLGTAARMLVHIKTLLAAAIEDCNRRPAQLPMLTDRERHELLVERNSTRREFPQRCLHELVEAIAAKTPNQIAVAHRNEQLSYGELNARANQLAHSLRKRGIARNVRVGICLERSLDFAVALVGVLKAGGTCVPLDSKYPQERLAFMLEDVAAALVLTERGLLQASIPAGTQVIYISEEHEKLAREPRSNPSADASGVFSMPSDIAYVIYTSGSTGRPRGVLLPHSGLANYTIGAAEQFELHLGDRMLQFCSISFDAALEEIFSTWAAGATLVFRDDNVSLEPSEFLAWVAEQRITAVDLPTAYWHEWVYALPELSPKVPAGLRLVIVGGEKASPEAFATWHKFVGNRVRWVNTYGPAEASVVATTYEPKLQPGDRAPAVLPIGRPVANARVYLLDPDLNPVPVGVPGELHIGGAGVAQGYLNLPELTQEKFIADIFNDDAASPTRMYKTGDLARYLPSGEIEFVGRRDHQVKIRGFRVEPGEIEAVLAKHAGVQEAAVVLCEDRTGSKRLVGYVVRNGESVTENELRHHVQKQLPEYMVPSELVFLESMPLTPNGKVNRRALLKIKVDSPSKNTPTTATNDPMQTQLITIWEELLGRKPIGIRDNFFELGGHSLLAARLMHRLKQISGKTLPLAALLQAPTVEQLADVLRGDFSHHWSSLVAIQPEGSKPPFFMVHGVGGNVVGFVELGQRMKPDYPFYGLQSQGLDGKRPLFTIIEDMAAHYLEEMRTVQPTGPYHLGGFSLGGIVAYEMARQLHSRGEEVGLLVLFDTYATNPKPVKLIDFLRHPGRIKFSQLPEELRRKIRRTFLAWRLPEYLKNVMHTNARAVEQYRLQPYSGKAILLRAGNSWLVRNDPYAAWQPMVGNLETIEIGGYHMDILREPQVSHLAERLKSCIDGAAHSLPETEVLAGNVG